MHKLNVLVIAAALATGSTMAGEKTATEGWHHDDIAGRLSDSHYSMFDGVRLTEQQRQQMRDLMSQARLAAPRLNISEMERLHTLVTAETFDEPAVRAQTEKMAQQQVIRQVEMAKVRNQMYNLLTPEQRQILNQKHQQRIAEIQLQMAEMTQTSTQKPVLSNE
ncbi:cell-envelope stress modulator CpxP [Acerihabitans arboris]|uniref:Periplasmic heavy metal sensor n=1 Tax=Acerihabitans arboris TaxID=2691583 RepID=A0A845SPE2_9GAMM|nr:cell-envelope stress modulator CpxP [Acerihabitans arboris]NDL64806.1 periplasmic heavy metal sensor [Acerihabitans arboris]